MIREQHIKSGKLLEVKFYPVFADGTPIPRGPKRKAATKAQKQFNDRQAVKKFVRLINANFDESDLLMHPTYLVSNAPSSEAEARRDVTNYIRRVKTFRKNEYARVLKLLKKNPNDERLVFQKKKLEEPFRYAYGLEAVTYKSGPKKGMKNYHFHLFMTGWGGRDRDEAEKLWTHGIRCNCDRFRPRSFGPEAAARYVVKSPAGIRRFSCSKNMQKPITEAPHDGRVTARQLESMVKQRSEDRTFWERRHRGYEFLGFEKSPSDCYNAYNGCYYLTVKFYKKERRKPKSGKAERSRGRPEGTMEDFQKSLDNSASV